MPIRSGLFAWLVVASARMAIAQFTEIPPAHNVATTLPSSPEIRAESQRLADRYEEALRKDIEFEYTYQLESITRNFKLMVNDNDLYERNTRAARQDLAREIAELEAGPEGRTPAGRARIDYLYGQLEQILLGSPLEPVNTLGRIAHAIPQNERAKAWATIVRARRKYVELPQPVPLASIAPGLPDTRAAFALERYRTELKLDGTIRKADLSVVLDSTTAPPTPVPRYFPAAPPIDQWLKTVGLAEQRYHYNLDQRRAAEAIANDVVARARELRTDLDEDYQTVAAFKNPEQRAAMTREIDRPIDAMYDELKQRLFNLASLDQRTAAGKSPASSEIAR